MIILEKMLLGYRSYHPNAIFSLWGEMVASLLKVEAPRGVAPLWYHFFNGLPELLAKSGGSLGDGAIFAFIWHNFDHNASYHFTKFS